MNVFQFLSSLKSNKLVSSDLESRLLIVFVQSGPTPNQEVPMRTWFWRARLEHEE